MTKSYITNLGERGTVVHQEKGPVGSEQQLTGPKHTQKQLSSSFTLYKLVSLVFLRAFIPAAGNHDRSEVDSDCDNGRAQAEEETDWKGQRQIGRYQEYSSLLDQHN